MPFVRAHFRRDDEDPSKSTLKNRVQERFRDGTFFGLHWHDCFSSSCNSFFLGEALRRRSLKFDNFRKHLPSSCRSERTFGFDLGEPDVFKCVLQCRAIFIDELCLLLFGYFIVGIVHGVS